MRRQRKKLTKMKLWTNLSKKLRNWKTKLMLTEKTNQIKGELIGGQVPW